MNPTLDELKTKHADLFEELVQKWAHNARRISGGRPDRLWAYSRAEQEFLLLMRTKGEIS